MRQRPPGIGVARVRSEARSEPVSGSVKTAVGSTSPDAIRGSQRTFCPEVPFATIRSQAISERVPSEPAAIQRSESPELVANHVELIIQHGLRHVLALAEDLVLAHDHAAAELRQVLRQADLQHPLVPRRKLASCRESGRSARARCIDLPYARTASETA